MSKMNSPDSGKISSASGTDLPQNPYGAPPGTGISMAPYYVSTPSVKNRNNYFPQSEPLGPDEMRIIFMGSQPFPPRFSQAGTCMGHPAKYKCHGRVPAITGLLHNLFLLLRGVS